MRLHTNHLKLTGADPHHDTHSNWISRRYGCAGYHWTGVDYVTLFLDVLVLGCVLFGIAASINTAIG